MNTLVLSLDFINDIVHPDGKLANQLDQSLVIANANKAIHWARANDHLVAHVKVGFQKGYKECPIQSPGFSKAPTFDALALGEWGTEFHESLDVQEEDFIVVKPRISPFYCTNLDALLRANYIERIVLFGVSTSMAVLTAAHDAHNRDYYVTVVSDACGTNRDPKTHDYALELLAPISEVITVDQL